MKASFCLFMCYFPVCSYSVSPINRESSERGDDSLSQLR